MGYRGKLAEQERARELRAQGYTMPKIAQRLGVARSSVSLWTRDVEFTPRRPRAAPRRSGPNKLQRRKQEEIDRLRAEGIERVGHLSEREFLVAGAALYAGEGAKRDGEVRFTNSDANMMKFFCAWLRYFFPIDERRLRVRLYLHEGLDLDSAMAHWSWITGVPEPQFSKPYRATPDGGIRHNKHMHGCIGLSYGCSRTHRAIMGLVRALIECTDFPG